MTILLSLHATGRLAVRPGPGEDPYRAAGLLQAFSHRWWHPGEELWTLPFTPQTLDRLEALLTDQGGSLASPDLLLSPGGPAPFPTDRSL